MKVETVCFLNILPEHLFNLKFAAKDLERNAKKCEKQEKEEKVKLKKVSITLDTKVNADGHWHFLGAGVGACSPLFLT
jgi:hypothetical protein